MVDLQATITPGKMPISTISVKLHCKGLGNVVFTYIKWSPSHLQLVTIQVFGIGTAESK